MRRLKRVCFRARRRQDAEDALFGFATPHRDQGRALRRHVTRSYFLSYFGQNARFRAWSERNSSK